MAATLRLSSIACGLLVVMGAGSASAEQPAPAVTKPAPLVTISKETTFITEPLRPDGYPDYLAALNARFGQGISPDNNAVVPLLKALGPHWVESERRPAYFKKLGIAPLDDQDACFVKLEETAKEWENAHPEVKAIGSADGPVENKAAMAAIAVLRKYGFALTPAQRRSFLDQEITFSDLLEEQLDKATTEPWLAVDYPILADWIAANEKALELAVEASQRPRYFDPLVPDADSESIISLPGIFGMATLCHALLARGTLEIQDGKFEQGCDDILACHRLARLTSQGPMLVDSLRGLSFEIDACRAEQGLATRAPLTEQQFAALSARLSALPALRPTADTIDVGERLFGLDVMIHSIRDRAQPKPSLFVVREPSWAALERELVLISMQMPVDWDETVREINATYDHLVQTSRIPSLKGRKRELVAFEAQLQEVPEHLKWLEAWQLLTAGRKVRGEQFGKFYSRQVIGVVSMVVTAQDRAITIGQVTQVALALAAYRAEHRAYPETLADLAPKYLQESPIDPFSDEALIYSRQPGGGYLLYSVGPNGKDDGGRNQDTDPDGDFDDIVVRASAPAK